MFKVGVKAHGAHLDSVTENSWNCAKSGVRPCQQGSSPKKDLTPQNSFGNLGSGVNMRPKYNSIQNST